MLRSTMKTVLPGLLIVALAGLFVGSGCSSDYSNPGSSTPNPNNPPNPGNPPPASNLVAISNFSFSPSTITVSVGETVTWRNDQNAGHTVTSDSGEELHSPLLNQGDTYQHTFNTAGTYSYHCTPHPSMTGTVIVQ